MLTTVPFQGFYNTMFGAGLEDAERSFIEYEAEQVKWMAARYEDKAPPKNPNQMEMSI